MQTMKQSERDEKQQNCDSKEAQSYIGTIKAEQNNGCYCLGGEIRCDWCYNPPRPKEAGAGRHNCSQLWQSFFCWEN